MVMLLLLLLLLCCCCYEFQMSSGKTMRSCSCGCCCSYCFSLNQTKKTLVVSSIYINFTYLRIFLHLNLNFYSPKSIFLFSFSPNEDRPHYEAAYAPTLYSRSLYAILWLSLTLRYITFACCCCRSMYEWVLLFKLLHIY